MKILAFSFVSTVTVSRDFNGKSTKIEVVDIKLTHLRAHEELERVSWYESKYFEYAGSIAQVFRNIEGIQIRFLDRLSFFLYFLNRGGSHLVKSSDNVCYS